MPVLVKLYHKIQNVDHQLYYNPVSHLISTVVVVLRQTHPNVNKKGQKKVQINLE